MCRFIFFRVSGEDYVAKTHMEYTAFRCPGCPSNLLCPSLLKPWAAVEAIHLVRELDRRIIHRGGDFRSDSFLVQMLVITMQRGKKPLSLRGTFAPGAIRGYLSNNCVDVKIMNVVVYYILFFNFDYIHFIYVIYRLVTYILCMMTKQF